ncbi:MAG: phosphatidylserine decarboxylase [Synergistaceae bacterium]|nr:phosphatidylserine decarboxylase [Synergistaceae bacterium]
MKIARDGWPVIAFTAFMLFGSLFFSPVAGFFLAPVLGLVIWFFRDPERAPLGDGFLSPADGKIVEIVEAEHSFTGRAVKIGIFMDPLDVHVNRLPCGGRVEYLEYVPGKKWMAFAPKASEVNERMYVGIRTDFGPVLIVQIAGFLARRIVCRLKKEDVLERGERFGMIKLGSKVDVYLPSGVKLAVTKGQKVFAGSTVLGGMPGDEA